MVRYQRGFNLISLLVGVVISLISILAMLSLYQSLVANALVATQDARQDGQVTSARLIIQNDLVGAGYGIEDEDAARDAVIVQEVSADASETEITVPGGASADEGNVVVWRYLDTSWQCGGFEVHDNGALYKLTNTGSCDSNFPAGPWERRLLMQAPESRVVKGQQFARRADLDTQPPFALDTDAACWPYGKGGGGDSHYQVTFTYGLTESTAGDADADVNKASVCLPNIKPSS